jgi:hypothetical protein
MSITNGKRTKRIVVAAAYFPSEDKNLSNPELAEPSLSDHIHICFNMISALKSS